jgi:hypothetical protein
VPGSRGKLGGTLSSRLGGARRAIFLSAVREQLLAPDQLLIS